jgi:hypothetical protein
MAKTAVLAAGLTFALLTAGAVVAENAGTSGAQSAEAHAMNVIYQDMKWQKIVPDLGDKSPEITILRVDPRTRATQLMIRVPKNTHVPMHWHSATRDAHHRQGRFHHGVRGQARGAEAGFVQLRSREDASRGVDASRPGRLTVHHGGLRLGRQLGEWSAEAGGLSRRPEQLSPPPDS